ncbi:MAG: anhydro-N-acetylmuramic acid kinase [Pirellulaceae bacterium]|nr:anhydro-N-acetylmuramic acid kinase [Pirellulaceae bacterium]
MDETPSPFLRKTTEPADRLAAGGDSSQTRTVIGISVDLYAQKIFAVMVTVDGNGLNIRPKILLTKEIVLSGQVTSLWLALLQGRPISLVDKSLLQIELTNQMTELAESLLVLSERVRHEVLALGVFDPGIWSLSSDKPLFYNGLCDSVLLAEQTGLNVIDHFPMRDLASGGQGEGVDLLAKWLFLSDNPNDSKSMQTPSPKGLIEVKETQTLLTYLPVRQEKILRPPKQIVLHVGPGAAYWEESFSKRIFGISKPENDRKPSISNNLGKSDLSPYFPISGGWIPEYSPENLRVIKDFKEKSLDSASTLPIMLAANIQKAIRDYFPRLTRVNDFLVHSPYSSPETLCQLLKESTEESCNYLPINTIGGHEVSLKAISGALLALLHLDQIPANSPEITGAQYARILGRLTPGCLTNWQYLLHNLIEQKKTKIALRTAI